MATPFLNNREEALPNLDELTPRQIVSELDKHVVGQTKAKRAVAVALRNRMRRRALPRDIADEIQPKNIILIGPTGVGKTELARRLARLSGSPFIKVEASKFTEVGYVGRDVEAIIRDLVDMAVDMVRHERLSEVGEKAEKNAEERILDLLLNPGTKESQEASPPKLTKKEQAVRSRARERLRLELRAGKLDQKTVELEVPDRLAPAFEIITSQGAEELGISLKDIFPGFMAGRTDTRTMQVSEAIEYLILDEENKLVEMEQVAREALDRVEESGIVFLDEIDKIAGRETGHGPEVSREGVQRDILPIVEGTTVNTRYGMVRTDFILFIASGAFHVSKPSDLIPELQGRFPIRVEMDALREEDFVKILQEPRSALVKQYSALLKSDGIELRFTKGALRQIAHFATAVNRSTQNIGARRLHTVMEALLDQISFDAPDLASKKIVVDAAYVKEHLDGIVKDEDLSRYIL